MKTTNNITPIIVKTTMLRSILPSSILDREADPDNVRSKPIMDPTQRHTILTGDPGPGGYDRRVRVPGQAIRQNLQYHGENRTPYEVLPPRRAADRPRLTT